MTLLKYGRVQTSLSQSSLPAVAQHMFSLMLRNMSSDGFVFTDPNAPGDFSAPGCIIAAPTFAVGPAVNQDYVYNWTRDAANTAIGSYSAWVGWGVRSAGGDRLICDESRGVL